jgi:shikimate kinase
MGSGKTTLGRILATRLGRRFDDSDAWIEAETGRSGADIARTDGVGRLHRLEAAHALRALDAPEPAVIAIAAAAVEDPAVRQALGSAVVVVLTADTATLVTRAAGSDHRRRLLPDPETATRALIARRRGLWEEVATGTVDTAGDVETAVAAALALAGE